MEEKTVGFMGIFFPVSIGKISGCQRYPKNAAVMLNLTLLLLRTDRSFNGRL